ncbi:MAG: glucokinase [Myxococcota bacterium]
MRTGPSYLVADIGGTNARFAIARGGPEGGFSLDHVRRFKNEEFAELRDAARDYLDSYDGERPLRGCMAAAAVVGSGVVQLTNASWSFHPDTLARDLGLESLLAVNDFAAQARGAPLTARADLVPIHDATPKADAPCAVLGPGTGLGLGLLVPSETGWVVVPTEGGHAGFAPRTEEEAGIRRVLADDFDFVSWERLLSGVGLVHIDRALGQLEGRVPRETRPEEITEEALAEPGSVSRRVVDVFCAVLGSFAGDVAVVSGALGGVYLGGGILPRIRPILEASEFVTRFVRHDPMTDYAASIPVWMITADTTPLLGAAALASASRG